MNILLGHAEPINNLVSADVLYMVNNDQTMIKVMEVWAPTAATIGYLLALDPVTTNCEEFTNANRANKLFTHIHINVCIQLLCLRETKNGLIGIAKRGWM